MRSRGKRLRIADVTQRLNLGPDPSDIRLQAAQVVDHYAAAAGVQDAGAPRIDQDRIIHRRTLDNLQRPQRDDAALTSLRVTARP